jgi:hypothetical protein
MTLTTTLDGGVGHPPAARDAHRPANARTGRHLRMRLQHVAAAGAVVALGILAPTGAGASTSSTGQPLPGPDGLAPEQPCDFELGPCPGQPVDPCAGDAPPDECEPVDPCEGDAPPEHCHPADPCEGDAPPEHCDSSTSIVPQVEVDAPVRATPNFTG